jgi:hypothetical protein
MDAATTLSVDETPSGRDDTVEQSILRFLNGKGDGHDLFQALYGEAMEEPIPAEMLALLRRALRP